MIRLLLAGALMCAGTACTTTYDAYGRPQQSVDPVLATAGVVAAGALGYALANNRSDRYYSRDYGCRSYRYRPYYGSNYCHY